MTIADSGSPHEALDNDDGQARAMTSMPARSHSTPVRSGFVATGLVLVCLLATTPGVRAQETTLGEPGPAETTTPSSAAAAIPEEASDDRIAAQAGPAAYDAVVDLTFPVAGPTSYVDSFHASRGGGTRVHLATDIMAGYGQSVHAAVGGTVTWITGIGSPVPSYGYMITISGDDGRLYSYIHLGRQDQGPTSAYWPGIARGTRVKRGQVIGTVGCSGNASCSAPHLHLEIEDSAVTDPYGGHQRNPYRSLRDAQQRGDVPHPASRSVGCTPSSAVPTTPVRRVTASGAVATSVAVSQTGWTRADEALVARADDYADALAGAALAAQRNAPLLLVQNGLASGTRAELQRLGVKRVAILGGLDAVPQTVEAAIAGVVPRVDRIAGPDRFATAAAVKLAVGVTGPEIVLALGRHENANRSWPDAISAGALAAGSTPVPVLLTENHRIPATTVTALAQARKSGVTTVLVIGGPAAIQEQVESQVAAIGLKTRRLHGATRYETSLEVVKAAAQRAGPQSRLVVASGISFVDALPSGPLAAQIGGALLLVPRCNLEGVAGAAQYITGRYRDGYVIGAEDAVSEGVREVLTNAIAG